MDRMGILATFKLDEREREWAGLIITLALTDDDMSSPHAMYLVLMRSHRAAPCEAFFKQLLFHSFTHRELLIVLGESAVRMSAFMLMHLHHMIACGSVWLNFTRPVVTRKCQLKY